MSLQFVYEQSTCLCTKRITLQSEWSFLALFAMLLLVVFVVEFVHTVRAEAV